MDYSLPFKQYSVTSPDALAELESEFRSTFETLELFPFAKGTSFTELSEIMPDEDGAWVNPLVIIICHVSTDIGRKEACNKTKDYIEASCPSDRHVDLLSISACVSGDKIQILALTRPYGYQINFAGFFDYIGNDIQEGRTSEEDASDPEVVSGGLIIPDEIKNFVISEDDKLNHQLKLEEQAKILDGRDGIPFLNLIDEYEPADIKTPADSFDLIYDLKTIDKNTKLSGTYENFDKAFRKVMSYANGTERYRYFDVLAEGRAARQEFLEDLKKFAYENCVTTGELLLEDLPALMKKINRALFQMYIIQDLINDPEVTDIKITAWNSIRCRVKGKAYITNLTFIDKSDYERFIQGLAIRNNISQKVPVQTFTDTNDENYILRFFLVAPFVTSEDTPYFHIRKNWRKKLLLDDLVKVGMLEPKVKDYLLDCCRHSRGIVIAGGPGSGKTVLLNALLEEGYEQSAEILVIQENDELFTYRKGVMFEHVVNERPDVADVTLERLGNLALVAGANVFIIGEAKGAEICSAITLSNSGCRTAITIHSNSSTDVINKMADLAQRGYAKDMVQAKRMLTSFQTLVFLKDFKVKEISEITGFDESQQDMIYRKIYRKDA